MGLGSRDEIVREFERAAVEVIEMKAHGLPSRKTLEILRADPRQSLEAFYDRYMETAAKFKKRDPSLIGGTFWMRPKAARDKTWQLLERCRDLALRFQMCDE